MTLGAVHRMLALFKYLKTFGDKRDVFLFFFDISRKRGVYAVMHRPQKWSLQPRLRLPLYGALSRIRLLCTFITDARLRSPARFTNSCRRCALPNRVSEHHRVNSDAARHYCWAQQTNAGKREHGAGCRPSLLAPGCPAFRHHVSEHLTEVIALFNCSGSHHRQRSESEPHNEDAQAVLDHAVSIILETPAAVVSSSSSGLSFSSHTHTRRTTN